MAKRVSYDVFMLTIVAKTPANLLTAIGQTTLAGLLLSAGIQVPVAERHKRHESLLSGHKALYRQARECNAVYQLVRHVPFGLGVL